MTCPPINRIQIPREEEQNPGSQRAIQSTKINKRACIVSTNDDDWDEQTEVNQQAEGKKHGGTERRGMASYAPLAPPVGRILYLSIYLPIYLYIRGSSRRVLEYGSDLRARKENGRETERRAVPCLSRSEEGAAGLGN